MSTDLGGCACTVVHLVSRRGAPPLVTPREGSAELLRFPSRADADRPRTSGQAAIASGREGADHVQSSLTVLLEATIQANVRTMQAMVRLTSPVGWIEVQQRAAKEYVTANLALAQAITQAVSDRSRPYPPGEHRS